MTRLAPGLHAWGQEPGVRKTMWRIHCVRHQESASEADLGQQACAIGANWGGLPMQH